MTDNARNGRYNGGRSSFRLPLCFAAAAIAIFLLAGDGTWMPGCIFHTLTGYDCPACGTQRACIALLHGRFRTAFMYNPYLFIIAPYLAAAAYAELSGRCPAKLRRLLFHKATIAFFAATMVAWWILRNTLLQGPDCCQA